MLPRMVRYGGEGLAFRTLGRTGLEVTPLCVGSAPLGNTPLAYKQDVPLENALATVRRVFEGPLNFLDTSNNYGDAEERIGLVIRELGGIPDGFVLETKVDRDMDTGDFSGDRVKRSVEESLQRLGLDRLGLVHFHDPENISFQEGVAKGGPLETLQQLKEEGVIAHLGVAGGPIDLMRQYIRTGAFDVVLTHNRFNLVDQSAEPLLDEASELGVAVLNAAPFGGGILAGSKPSQGFFAYKAASEDVLTRVEELHAAADRHGVPLAAAALQFPMREPRITATLAGCVTPAEVDRLIEHARWEIPGELWEEIAP
jgi:D-threo-aldose 1-dehydrogenase